MQFRLEFDADGSSLTIHAWGEPTLEGFREYLDAIPADPRWRRGMPVLCEFRGLDVARASTELILELVALHRDFVAKHGTNRVAIVVSEPAAFGTVRMWQARAEEQYPQLEVHYSREAALDWLFFRERKKA